MKKSTIKTVGVMLILIISLAFFLNYVTNSIKNEIQEERSTFGKYIGTDIVIDKDTLKIIDYSLMNRTYTLSNGLVVSNEITKH